MYVRCRTYVQRTLWLVLIAICIAAPARAQEETPDSLKALKAAVEAAPKNGDAWVRLGEAYLAAGEIDGAQDAFKKGISHGKLAAAYHGLARVYTIRCREMSRSLFCLRVEPNLEKAIKRDPEYAPAYLTLAEWYRGSGYEDRMVNLYERYLALRPGDAEGRFGLARTYTDLLQYSKVLEVAEPALAEEPEDVRWLPIVAQAYAAEGDADQALALFERYFDTVSDAERALYDDLSLVARPDELEAYRSLPPEAQEDFLRAFWRQRDPTLVSEGRLRQAEHYRRVWYARTYFADKVQPWDRRGEVYIRFGEPDYRSRSDRVNRIPGPMVELVKQRNAFRIYETGMRPASELFVLNPLDPRLDPEATRLFGPEFGAGVGQGPEGQVGAVDQALAFGEQGAAGAASSSPTWDWTEHRRDGLVYWRKPPDVADERWVEPVFPIDRWPDGSTRVPWESWVYTKVGGGVEFVFTDQVGSGRWNFAAMPPAAHSGLLTRVASYDPGLMLQTVTQRTPDFFDLPPGIEPLEFYYDLASFQGEPGQTAVEVYVGIPLERVAAQTAGERSLIQVDRTVVLTDPEGKVVSRVRDDMSLAFPSAYLGQNGALIPDMVPLQAPPGDYRLAVQLEDRASGKWGIYLQDVAVPAYEGALAMSDLELAGMISSLPGSGKFKKGDVWVVPMPSRSYRKEQSVYIYYEVYNLQKDEFGQTNYRVDYTIRRDIRRGVTLFGGIAAGLDLMLRRERPEVEVGYERSGRDASEPIYLELDTKELKSGLNQIEVQVTDLNAGMEVARKAMFRLDKR